MMPEELRVQDDLRILQDRQEIGDLLATYTRGLDRRDEALVASVYHSDATHDHGMFRGSGAEFAKYAVKELQTMERTMHCLQHSLIEFRSGNTAVGETYCIAYHRIASRQAEWADHTVWVRYLDSFEKRLSGPWLISQRVVVFEWSRIDLVQREWQLTRNYTRGQSDGTDPIYGLLGVRRREPSV